MLSNTKLRQQSGRQYAEENIGDLTKGMDKEKDVFRLVTHSMGGAFAEEMIEYLKEQGWKVSDLVNLDAWTPQELNSNKKDQLKGVNVVDATITNDWVQALSINGSRDIPGASRVVRKKSEKGWQSVHRDLIDSGEELWNKTERAR